MKTYLKVFTLFTLLFINGCSKDDDGGEIIDPIVENKAKIIANDLELKDAQIGFINVTDYSLSQNTYNGKFGDTNILLAKEDNTTLSFLVPPNLDSGTYNLNIDFSSNSLDFNITKTTLSATPENVIKNFVGNYETEIDETIELFSQGNAPPILLAAKEDIEKAIIELNSLSENDKIIAAKFIQNNTIDLIQLETELVQENLIYAGKSINKNCTDARCYLSYGLKVIGAIALVKVGGVAAIVGAVVVGIDAIISLIEGKRSILLSKTLILFKEAVVIYIPFEKLKEVLFNAIDGVASNLAKSQAVKIENNTSISFTVQPTFRTLNESDKDSSDSVIKSFVDAYLNLKDFWNQNFASNVGALPSFNDLEKQKVADELSFFSIEITENSENVSKSEITGTAEEFSVTFTNETDVEQDFTFDVVYNDGENEEKSSISLTIKPDEIFLEKVSGDNQEGTQGEALENPIIVKVVDKDNNPISDVDVEFNITAGEGSLNGAATKTNTDGLAQVSWTLGDNLDDQTLEVLVKNSEGENISGSPLVFSATAKELELHLEKFEGDNQIGEAGQPLPENLKLFVKDKDDNLIDGITVYYAVTAGGGSVTATDVSAGGFTEATWVLGNNTDTQTVEATLKDSNGNVVSALIFNASFTNPIFGDWEAISYNGKTMGELTQEGYIVECDVYRNSYSIDSSSLVINANTIGFNVSQTSYDFSATEDANGEIDCDTIIINAVPDGGNASFNFEDFIKIGNSNVYEKVTTFSDGQVNTIIIRLINNNQVRFTNNHKDIDNVTRTAYSILYNRK
jgi:hypothetical protein